MSDSFCVLAGQSMLSARDLVASSAARAAQWRPGLKAASNSEVFAAGNDASGGSAALALALDELRQLDQGPLAEAEDRRAVLWVQDRASVRLTGRPYRPGLPQAIRHRVIHVMAEKVEDALFALEEGLRCRDLACVIGELAGNPRALDFTASRRLSLAAEKHGVPLWLVRIDAARDLSSARMRWQVKPAVSHAPQWNAQAPGQPRWHAELFRARSHPPGNWILSDDGQTLTADRTVSASGKRATAPHPVGMAFAAGGRSLAG
uniref:ImuA family protein n=1 Tax=Parerythrobacter lutipelagi TaxID=1964208 RepID=UPI001864BCFD|nr:recA-like protein [Parerythrobacter lutipelagi]